MLAATLACHRLKPRVYIGMYEIWTGFYPESKFF